MYDVHIMTDTLCIIFNTHTNNYYFENCHNY
jgi:hypothetical protein